MHRGKEGLRTEKACSCLGTIEFDDKVNIAYGLITSWISEVDRLCCEGKPYVQVLREVCTDAWYTPV